MRIIDRLMSDPVYQAYQDRTGKILKVDASIDVRQAMSECHVRYVLDRDTSRQCANMMRSQPEVFDLESGLLRFPTETCWIEFLEDCDEGDGRQAAGALRHGILAHTDKPGRSGSLRAYLEQSDGTVVMVPGTLEFDLDRGMACNAVSTFSMRNSDLPGLSPVLEKVALRPYKMWLDYAAGHGAQETAHLLRFQAESMWYVLPYSLCFSALLNTRTVFRERSSDLGRLNRARARRGRHPLLDHVEVSLQLGSRTSAYASGALDSGRRTSRMHVVRGHTVQRSGKTFWRSTHIRGEGIEIIGSRTVKIRSGI